MAFIPAHRFIGSPDAPHLAFVLHGALGSAQNWVSFSKVLAEHTPSIRYVLIDIRGHGASLNAPSPHGLTEAANDLASLADDLRHTPRVVIGHSLGGKLALEYARLHSEGLEQVWCLDANPAAQPHAQDAHGVFHVFEQVRAVQQPVPSRSAAVAALEERGLATPIAKWLATSLRQDVGGYRFTYDFECVQELLADYFARDLWDYVETPRDYPTLHLVVAAESDSWTPGFRRRVEQLGPIRGVIPHVLPNSGHWVHIDNAQGLWAMMVPTLTAGPAC